MAWADLKTLLARLCPPAQTPTKDADIGRPVAATSVRKSYLFALRASER
jgi:hypothetical protein